MKYPYDTNPKYIPDGFWRRCLHRLELRLAYRRYGRSALKVRRFRQWCNRQVKRFDNWEI